MTYFTERDEDEYYREKNEDKSFDKLLENKIEEKLEEKLNVIVVLSNPCLYIKKYYLALEFITRMKKNKNVNLCIVEMCYENQKFIITEPDNKNHLQLRTEVPLWHKENMINVGIRRLLPPKWKAVAWIDADVEFESGTWALDTLKVLNGYKDVVQVFSHCIDMEKDESAMRIFSGFGFQYDKKQKYSKDKTNYWHPGYAWAMTRKAYDRIGGLYEYGILGSGDNIMSLSILEQGLKGIHVDSTDEYKESIVSFQTKMKTLRLGYVPGVIRHHYHGRKQDRKYTERWRILTDSFYNPREHLTKDAAGLIVPTASCPKGMITQIKEYFYARNEDDLTIFMDK
jgi:hypothetical protein